MVRRDIDLLCDLFKKKLNCVIPHHWNLCDVYHSIYQWHACIVDSAYCDWVFQCFTIDTTPKEIELCKMQFDNCQDLETCATIDPKDVNVSITDSGTKGLSHNHLRKMLTVDGFPEAISINTFSSIEMQPEDRVCFEKIDTDWEFIDNKFA